MSKVVDEAAVAELLSFFPARDVDQPSTRGFPERRVVGFSDPIAERLAQIDARLSRIEAYIEALAADTDAGSTS